MSGTLFASPGDRAALAAWVQSKAGNGQTDARFLYGYLPESIYPPRNTQPDGSDRGTIHRVSGDLSDPVYVLNFLFVGGRKPVNCADKTRPRIRIRGCPNVCK